jgi:hypothetical protein
MEITPLKDAISNIPDELNRIVMACLEKQKDTRYQSAAAVHADLLSFKKLQNSAFGTSDLANFMKQFSDHKQSL